MIEYPKIQTLFKRDANSIIIPSKFTSPEFEYLKDNKWECTEKVDGTNMSVHIIPEVSDFSQTVNYRVEIHGRTERANIPAHLKAKMEELFTLDKLKEALDLDHAVTNGADSIILYGEGYGVKIQSCGGRYLKNSVNFRLFDVKVCNWWLTREACEDIAIKLGIDIVPVIGYMTIPEAIEYVKKGFKSLVAEDDTLDAEGLVLKTPCGLKNRAGDRIITKIKTCDFKKFNAMYGENYTGEQPKNQHYD